MFRFLVLSLALYFCSVIAVYGQADDSSNSSQQSQTVNSSDQQSVSTGESSSKSTQIDITPPEDDDKNHPDSAAAVSEEQEESAPNNLQVEEFHRWNPHKAAKDVEVGDFYFKQGNYKAALSRYQEALQYKQNDAVANFRSAQCFEKLNNPQDAAEHYEAYLKILPHGPFSNDAKKALTKLQANPTPQNKSQ